MFKLNLKIALRNLWKHKGFTLINVGGLAIGMACCLMLLLYVNYEWSFDKQYKNADKVYFATLNLKYNGRLATTMAVPNKLANAAMTELPGIKNAARITMPGNFRLYSHDQNHFKLEALSADPSFLQILDQKFIYGNPETALAEPNNVLINASTAKKLFGNQNPLGQLITYDNKISLKVSAVIEDLPKNQTIQFDVLQPWTFYEQENPGERENGWGAITCLTLFQLKDNADLTATNVAIKNFIVNKEADLKEMTYQLFLFPLAKFHLYDHFENGKSAGGKIDQLRLFVFLAICVLLIACINYMNLSTAKSEKRAREVGVRKALGSTRNTIMGQFMIESLLLSVIAMAIAFITLELSLPYFNNLLNISINIDYSSYPFWMLLLSMVLITGLLAGSYPAFYLSSFIPVKVLKGFKGSTGSLSIRKTLVILQFSLSICMIISAIVIYKQMQYMRDKPLGFDVAALAQIDLEGVLTNPGKLEVFKNELKRAGAIESATEYASSFTRGGNITSDISWPDKPKNDVSVISYRSTGFNFANTAGIKIVAGRDFASKFPADTATSLLLNQEAVKVMRLKNPVGTVITWGDNPPLKVVGVVQDFFNESLGAKVSPTVYYYNAKKSETLLLRLNTKQSLTASLEAIKQVSQRLNPAYPAEIRLVSDGMAEKIKSEKLLSVLSNIFGGFAIFISCLGLLGLALYMAEQRSKEISIRKVLGANLSDILVLLNKDFMKLVVIANLIAIPVAYILVAKWLEKYDYKISINPWPFLLALLTSILIALITVSLQTFKVAKANAVDALKYE
ncbi:FtsX-like permease family protein [Pedobacter suwonensis]|uniref:FtsX-like permease family protein n=1 Tax=Pedobacter suwonensis TaxID=332999 RepID=A0A1I0T253_9SPHI|nr:ABC transporter permease [Pedobacter suwonensis]SFA45849.1 FtsX-like permease family protein [Pedobacter suwonensis]